ncbi:VanZ family protein [Methylocystis sp. MJC1]|uniref:VanZ family protein n=1 Tax=Methylocystis sp. MJC1 TaxID=2654282 RepID=UPI0013EA6AB1|nr:VanZ family protein [Methylocystis sp. MJC1]MBU6528316.1 VanZ family protein [Methylocystis sp. MJC1]
MLAWACVLVILALSLAPGDARPHTILPGKLEHFIAYAGTGFLFSIAYRCLRTRAQIWGALVIASVVLEAIQSFIPGRSPDLLDALASSMGLTVGLTFGAVLTRLGPRA